MVSAIEFSYLNTSFSLHVDENVLNRAVRVKNMVKDKIKRVFDSNFTVEVEQKVADVVENASLLNLSDEKLSEIAEVLDRIQLQEKVTTFSNRAVLFTSGLMSKIRLVTSKWYPYNSNVSIQNDTLSSELNSIDFINNLGGEVVPGAWDNVADSLEQNQSDYNFDNPVADAIQAPIVEYSSDDSDIYSFEPNMDDFIPNFVSNNFENNEINFSNESIVPEPNDLSAIPENEFVPEPMSVSTFEVKPSNEDDMNSNTEVGVKEEKVKAEDKSKLISIEDRIAQLLQRKSVAPSNKQDLNVETRDTKEVSNEEFGAMSEKVASTQAHVVARIRRMHNEMNEKDETIKRLNSKYNSLVEENNQAKDKIKGYEAVVSDLTAKNDSLIKDNERLVSKASEVQSSSEAIIAKLESQLDELTKAKNDEAEAGKEMIAQLKNRHAEEIAELNERHAKELRLANESKERQIQAIYSTISEVLGETALDDSYEKSMAA